MPPQDDQNQLGRVFETLNHLNQLMVKNFLQHLPVEKGTNGGDMLRAITSGVMENTEQWVQMQNNYYKKQVELWMHMLGRHAGRESAPVVEPEKTDRRFHAPEWSEYPFFDYVKQYYLLTSNWLMDMVESSKLEEGTKKRMAFITKQYVDAMAPSNFAVTNPEVLKLVVDTKGENVAAGLKNFLEDLQKGRISMTDESAFEIGKNIAVSEGAVVYQNDLFQLIQYRPLTDKVHERPLLIVPPCINKFYILDLQQENSFVRYAVEQGHSVFLMSWRNIPPELGHLTWDDYIGEGVLRAVAAVKDITGVAKINALGWCIGGTLLVSALGVMAAHGDDSVASYTLLTTMLDYTDPGEICVFLDPVLLQKREAELRRGGIVPGKELADTFASLRANDLVWFYVVNNYLKGRKPEAFDLLYWNSDGTNLPGPMYTWYLRNMYHENNMIKPGGITVCGEPLDLARIKQPGYILAAREDHIVPWKSAYASVRYLGGPLEFVLGASGHIAGVINPPGKGKRNFWAGGELSDDGERWLESAQAQPGSWWPHWSAWLKPRAGKLVAARSEPGSKDYPKLEDAPGSYVKVRCG